MFWLKRAAILIPVLLLISLSAFALVRLAPGGPFDRDRAPLSPEIERALQERYHLDEPVFRQYLRFLAGLVSGDLGPSLKYRNHTVSDIISQGLPVSAILGVMAFFVSVGLGAGLGLVGASGSGWRDAPASFIALLAVCIPVFVTGPILMLVLAVRWRLLPVALWGDAWSWVLPVLTLGIFYAGRVARLMREGVAQTLRAGFIRTARAKGASELAILFRHVFPVAILPVVTYSGPLLADLLTGSFVVENLFQLPGIGTLTVNSALNRDYPLIVGLVLLYAVILLILNLAVDLLHAWLDPRVRHE